jgi:hypothetical protein
MQRRTDAPNTARCMESNEETLQDRKFIEELVIAVCSSLLHPMSQQCDSKSRRKASIRTGRSMFHTVRTTYI